MTWVMLEKNGKIYKYQLVDSTHLFNRGIMDVQIEGWNPTIPMNYDDIICIRTGCIKLKSLPVLPLSLRELEIRYSELTSVPVFPTGIRKVQLLHSKIELSDEQLTEIRALYPKTFIQIENPNEYLEGKPVDIQEEVQYRIARYGEEHLRMAREEIRAVRHGPRPGEEKNVLDSNQTVHISSINDCICKSISIIQEKSNKYPVVSSPIDALFVSEKGVCYRIKDAIFNFFGQRGKLYKNLKFWCDDKQVHSLHKLTFLQLFQMVMNITEVHPQKEDLKERIRTELTDSIQYCFTGRINRLVNSLVGFVEGVMVGITVRETLQIKIQALVQRLMNKKINVKQAKDEMTKMFAEVGEEDNITDTFKNANLLALDDFLEDNNEMEEPNELVPLIVQNNNNFPLNFGINFDFGLENLDFGNE